MSKTYLGPTAGNSYHLVLVGLFTGLGYLVQSELESGFGRNGVSVFDPGRSRCLVLVLKHSEDESRMQADLAEATDQIAKKRYDSRLRFEGYATVLRYGMAFSGKRAVVARARHETHDE